MVRNLMMILGLSLTIAAFGCDSESGDGGAGAGGNGAAGEGGAGGGAGAGGGEGGSGGSEAPVDQCTADEISDIEGGEPATPLVTACATAAVGTVGNMDACVAQVNTCLQDGNAGATDATTLSEGCSGCTAEASCCTLNECSVLVAGPCAGAPVPGDDCDLCIQEKCAPRQEACVGDGEG